MKKLFITFIILILILSIGGCTENKNDSAADNNSEEQIDWGKYNGRADEFVHAMANGDFDAAVAMFDATMAQVLPASALQSDVWDLVCANAGAFIEFYEKENQAVDGYYICFITSRHENTGVKLRVVFSENTLIAGLFIEDYPAIQVE